jgi:nucleoside-diphosphate-sugar epimerase
VHGGLGGEGTGEKYFTVWVPISVWCPNCLGDRLQQLGLKFLPVDITNMEWIYKYLLPDQEPPLTRYTLGLLAFSQTLDMTSAKIKLGYEPRISMEQGLDEFVRCWKF